MEEKRIESIPGVRDAVLCAFTARPLPGSVDDFVDWYECRMAFHDDVPDHEAFINDFLARYQKSYLSLLRFKKVGPIDEVLGHSGFRGSVDNTGVAFMTVKTVKKGKPPITIFDDLSPFRRKPGS